MLLRQAGHKIMKSVQRSMVHHIPDGHGNLDWLILPWSSSEGNKGMWMYVFGILWIEAFRIVHLGIVPYTVVMVD